MSQIREKAHVFDMGNIVEVDVYPHKKRSSGRRSAWRPTSEAQAIVNQNRKRRYVSRLVNKNFDTSSLMLEFDYTDDNLPDSAAEANKNMQNWIRRIRRLYKAAGRELKYIYCTEEGETTGRLHHHVIISGGIAKEKLLKAWRAGKRNFSDRLEFNENGFTEIAIYTAKKAERFRRSYTTSKNLIKPEPLPQSDRTARETSNLFTKKVCENLLKHNYTRAELAAMFPGFKLCDGWTCRKNPYDNSYYLHLRLIRAGSPVAEWATTLRGTQGDEYPWATLEKSEKDRSEILFSADFAKIKAEREKSCQN